VIFSDSPLRGAGSGIDRRGWERRARTAAFAAVALVFSFTLAGRASAQDRGEAGLDDLRRLQESLANLDDELAALPPGESRTEEFRSRADAIRDETIYLKVKMEHHQRDGGAGTGLTPSEVAEVRHRVDVLREDIDRAFGREGQEVRLPAGTSVQVRLSHALSSRTARREDRVDATVADPVRGSGELALPAGTLVRGVVRAVDPAERPSKAGRLEIEFDSLYLDDTRFGMRGRVAAIEESGERGKKAGIGAVVGGILGGLIGGKSGAIAGILVGGGGAVVATKGDDVDLPAGTVLTVRLEEPLVLTR
jgi:hypothetical protein